MANLASHRFNNAMFLPMVTTWIIAVFIQMTFTTMISAENSVTIGLYFYQIKTFDMLEQRNHVLLHL